MFFQGKLFNNCCAIAKNLMVGILDSCNPGSFSKALSPCKACSLQKAVAWCLSAATYQEPPTYTLPEPGAAVHGFHTITQ